MNKKAWKPHAEPSLCSAPRWCFQRSWGEADRGRQAFATYGTGQRQAA